jgi:uncharacterized protein with von Willebrand factor type A (vWA) domain
MALLETFELIASVVESGILENIAIEAQSVPEVFMVLESSESLKESITRQIDLWKNKLREQLLDEPIAESLNDEIAYYVEVNQYSSAQFFDEIETIVANIEINSPFHIQANKLLEEQKNRYNPLFKHYFFDQWHAALFTQLQDEKLEALKNEKEKLLEDLYQRIDTISQLTDIEEAISDQKKLRLWDMAKSKLTKGDVSSLQKMADYLRDNSALQQIAENLGRMASEIDCNDQTAVKIEERINVEKTSLEAAENIVGIHESDELERLMSTELLYLAYPELEVIFYKHLADKRLSTYQLQGKIRTIEKKTTYKQKAKQAEIPAGPFIIAVDASGSMMGLPEQAAKALTYGLMQIALAENRACYVIIFSANQITYELTSTEGLNDILSFLSYTFNGGTDLTPVLEKAIEVMNSEDYINADLVVISDFISPPQQQAMIDKITAIKANQNRFHAVSLSKHGNPQLLSIFDHYWEFYPSRIGLFKNILKRW